MESRFAFRFLVEARLSTSFVEEFREIFPEFSDPEEYPDAKINFYESLAESLMDKCTWADLYSQGLRLFIAHNLWMEKYQQSLTPGSGGFAGGPLAGRSRSVDGVSYSDQYMVSYYRNAGWWANSIYGQQYYDLIQLVGAKPMQLWNQTRCVGRHRYQKPFWGMAWRECPKDKGNDVNG